MGESGSLWTRFKLKIWTHHATDLQMLASELLQVLSLQRLTSLQYLSLQSIGWELCPPLLRVIVENHSTIRKISLDVLLPYVPFSRINELAGLTSALVKFEEVDLTECDFRYMAADGQGSVDWRDDTGAILTALLAPPVTSKLRILTVCGDERKFSTVLAEARRVREVHWEFSQHGSVLASNVTAGVKVKWVPFERNFEFYDHPDSDSDSDFDSQSDSNYDFAGDCDASDETNDALDLCVTRPKI